MAKIWKCQKRAKMSITYPKVCQSIHGKYYIDFVLNNKRYRLKNGNKIKLKLNPNSFPVKYRPPLNLVMCVPVHLLAD